MNPGDVVRHKSGKFPDGTELKVVRFSIQSKIPEPKCVFWGPKRDIYVPENDLELVEAVLQPGQKVIIGRHHKLPNGSFYNWVKEMETMVGKEAEVMCFQSVCVYSNTAYYRLKEGNGFSWLREALTPVGQQPACSHAWVNVGFASVTMACKHCGIDQP